MILLDTHVLLWFLEEPKRLGRQAFQLVEREIVRRQAAWSTISVFETALLLSRGRLRSGGDVSLIRNAFLSEGGREYPVDGDIALRAGEIALPDPFDRIITATAEVNACMLVTADKHMLERPGALRRHDARK